jgi:Ala-tRNA(Pro) deacylase
MKNKKHYYMTFEGADMNIEYVDKTLYSARPSGFDRLEKEMETYDILEKLNIPFKRVDHYPAASSEECAEIEAVLGMEICKNLFLCNQSKTEFYLYVLPGSKKFVTREVSKQIGTSRLSFGDAAFMKELLNVTPGSVSIFGLMYDKGHKINLLLDREIVGSEFVCFHPCINTSTLRLKTSDILEKFLPYTGHRPVIVE